MTQSMPPARPERALTIEDASLAAAPLMAALTEAAGAERWSVEILEGILAGPQSLGLIACSGTRPAGFLLAQFALDQSEILNLAVLPAARRQGIGRSLLTAAMARAQARDARTMFLEVAGDNVAARALYENAGFAQVGIRPDYYRRSAVNYMDALILRRNLITSGDERT